MYLVTGGAGFIGSNIVDALVRRGERVRILDDFSTGSLANLAAARNVVTFAPRKDTPSSSPVRANRGSCATANEGLA